MGYIAEGFYHWGLWSAKRPLISILIGVCLVIIGFCGFINGQTTVSKLLVHFAGRPSRTLGPASLQGQRRARVLQRAVWRFLQNRHCLDCAFPRRGRQRRLVPEGILKLALLLANRNQLRLVRT